MPIINGKHLPYTKENMAKAKKMKHSGKGTRARLDTAAKKQGF